MNIAPHAPNQLFDLNTAKRCGAHARQTGKPCKQPAMNNGKCRLHGGKSRGAKTRRGERIARLANYRHGERSKAQMAKKRQMTTFINEAIKFTNQV